MSNPKELRKQIRNVIQETGKELLTAEVGETLKKELTAHLDARLNQIDQYVQSFLDKNAKRDKAVQGFLIQEVTGRINTDLFNATVTVDAVVAVLAEAGLGVENFAAKIDEKKKTIAADKIKAAGEKMEADAKARSEEAEQRKANTPRIGEEAQAST